MSIDYKESIFWDVSGFPTRKTEFPYYFSMLCFLKGEHRKTIKRKDGTEGVEHGQRRFYIPANEAGMKKMQELIDCNKYSAVYRSQACFTPPTTGPDGKKKSPTTHGRDQVSVITHLWIDLDIDKLGNTTTTQGQGKNTVTTRNIWYRPDIYEEWASLDDDGKAKFLLKECELNGIPEPTEIILSGGGAYCLWQFEEPVKIIRNAQRAKGQHRRKAKGQKHKPRTFIDVAEEMNEEIERRLKYLMADHTPTTAQTVLRVPGSWNMKYGQSRLCRVVHRNPEARYQAHDLRYTLLNVEPYSGVARWEECKALDAEIKKNIKARQKAYDDRGKMWAKEKADRQAKREAGRKSNVTAMPVRAKHSVHKQSQRIIRDLETLARDRWGGRVGDGFHDLFGHIAVAVCSAQFPGNKEALIAYVRSQIEHFMDPGYMSNRFEKDNETSFKMLMNAPKKDDEEPEPEEPGYSPWRYAYKIDTIIKVLSITEAEMANLVCLVSKGIKENRNRKATTARRRASGARPRKDYERDREKIKQDKPWEAEGISKATWYRRGGKKVVAPVVNPMVEPVTPIMEPVADPVTVIPFRPNKVDVVNNGGFDPMTSEMTPEMDKEFLPEAIKNLPREHLVLNMETMQWRYVPPAPELSPQMTMDLQQKPIPIRKVVQKNPIMLNVEDFNLPRRKAG